MLFPLSLKYLVILCYAVSYVSLICMSPIVKIDYLPFCAILRTYLHMRIFFPLYSQSHKLNILYEYIVFLDQPHIFFLSSISWSELGIDNQEYLLNMK